MNRDFREVENSFHEAQSSVVDVETAMPLFMTQAEHIESINNLTRSLSEDAQQAVMAVAARNDGYGSRLRLRVEPLHDRIMNKFVAWRNHG